MQDKPDKSSIDFHRVFVGAKDTRLSKQIRKLFTNNCTC